MQDRTAFSMLYSVSVFNFNIEHVWEIVLYGIAIKVQRSKIYFQMIFFLLEGNNTEMNNKIVN